ncbi:MAG: glycosyltransferase [Clostridia bacterium]|nr:glycosyltransferase [Clostridia bacterium]
MTENSELNICLLNDSFPPQIDGVANTVVNYGRVIAGLGTPTVLAPSFPGAEDDAFPFDVIRYPSIDVTKQVGYMAGIPFSNELMDRLEKKKFDIIHSHCPVISTYISRVLRSKINKPIILTYHSKFEFDIKRAIKSKLIRREATKLLLSNIEACDEVWCVSRGAGYDLEEIGYTGTWSVMPNGVDLSPGRSDADKIISKRTELGIPAYVPVFLFVGRMMWYKGIKIILDALRMLCHSGKDFRMVFVGSGQDKDDIISYADSLPCRQKIIFNGPVYDREELRVFYSLADVFLFPSTYDTNGLVVREAAACSLPSVLVKGSCAAEDVTDGTDGFLIDENAESMFSCLCMIYDKSGIEKKTGENALKNLYISWDDSIKRAYGRYFDVIDNFNRGLYPAKKPLMPDKVYSAISELTDKETKFIFRS